MLLNSPSSLSFYRPPPPFFFFFSFFCKSLPKALRTIFRLQCDFVPYCKVIAILQGDCIEKKKNIYKIVGIGRETRSKAMVYSCWYKIRYTQFHLFSRSSASRTRTITATNCLRIIPLIPSCFALLHCSTALSCVRYGLNFCTVPSSLLSTELVSAQFQV